LNRLNSYQPIKFNNNTHSGFLNEVHPTKEAKGNYGNVFCRGDLGNRIWVVRELFLHNPIWHNQPVSWRALWVSSTHAGKTIT
jgi:hypothetical protein